MAMALDVHAGLFEHLAQEINGTEPRGLGTDQRTAVGHALAGQYARVLACQFTVHAVEVSDFAAAHADVARRDVGLGADMAPQLDHEGLAETHYLTVGFALGVEIRAAFGTAHGQRRQRILENLLETEEFQDRGIHRGMETQAALVGADCVVELDAVPEVDLDIALVIDPDHLEGEDTVRLHDAFCNAVGLEFRMLVVSLLYRHENFAHGLQVFAFAGVLALKFRHQFVYVHIA